MTRVVESLAEWRRERQSHVRAGITLGFVPTMGALHEGHLSLVERSRRENDRTLVSIFVNPTQFNDPGDFARYPRVLDDDVMLLRGSGADYVIVPREDELYPDGYRYRVTEMDASRVLEGVARPGHFEGMLTVVLKLLHIAAAERAYFGEKDWQQLSLVRGLVEAFHVPTSIVGCPTIREHDGLAASSRNRRLAPAHRQKAPLLYQALIEARSAEQATDMLTASGFDVEYVADWDGRRLAAVRIGGVRLIDNIPLAQAS